MPWPATKQAARALKAACESGQPVAEPWRAFVAATAGAPPDHLRSVLATLAAIEAERPGAEIAILDHGTGSGINLLYLAARGYTGGWGANVVPKAQALNRVFRQALGTGEDRIFLYDGRRLPFADASFDLVLSQQVVEHVPDSLIEDYYAEEGRVLRPGGRALHHVPHRLMPYDSHTRTWFVHYLPAGLRRPVYRGLGRDADYFAELLHLRGPGAHRTRLRRHIGPVRDLTLARLRAPIDLDAYDGPRGLRRLLTRLLRLPLLGPLAGTAIRPLVMLETITTKRGA